MAELNRYDLKSWLQRIFYGEKNAHLTSLKKQ